MIQIGDIETSIHTITNKDIENFAKASGDYNPIHLEDKFAEKTIFGKRIAHGMLSASYISAILGTKLPGEGSIYLSQTLKFTKPVYIGDTVMTVVKVIDKKGNKVTLETACKNQRDEMLIIGEAKLLVPEDQ